MPTTPTRKRKGTDPPREFAVAKQPRSTAPQPRCLGMTSTPPRPSDYKLRGEIVYDHEFTVAHPDGTVERLWVVPATDALPCGRGMLAHIGGLESVLLSEYNVSSLEELRELERLWVANLFETDFELKQYRARKAEIEADLRAMTRKQLKRHESEEGEIIKHDEGLVCARRTGLPPAVQGEACSADLKRWVSRLRCIGWPHRKPLLDILVSLRKTTKLLVADMTDAETTALIECVDRELRPRLPPPYLADFAGQLSRLQSRH